MNIFEENAKAEVEARRKAVQLAEQAKPVFVGVDMAKQGSDRTVYQYPGDEAIIGAVADRLDVPYATAVDWVMETAERMKVAA